MTEVDIVLILPHRVDLNLVNSWLDPGILEDVLHLAQHVRYGHLKNAPAITTSIAKTTLRRTC